MLRGDAGEIWVKGPNVFQGYLDDPEQTARVLTADGWLRTGDIAVTDDDGYLYLVDRAKDLIIVSGFNVYPGRGRRRARRASGGRRGRRRRCAASAHGRSGEGVGRGARAGMTVDEDTLIAWCSEHLARYKCPSKILFVDELPRNVSGKLLRRSLT